MPDADDFDVEELRSLMRGEGGPPPAAVPKAATRPSAKTRAPGKAGQPAAQAPKKTAPPAAKGRKKPGASRKRP